MSDYLSNVAAKSLNLIEPIHPRLASRFEPLPAIDWLTAGLPLEAEPVEEAPRPASMAFEAAQLSVSAPVSAPPTAAPRQPLAAPMAVVPTTPDRSPVDQPLQSLRNSTTGDVVPPSARSSTRPSSARRHEARQQGRPTSLPIQDAPLATQTTGDAPSSVIPSIPATVGARPAVAPHVESVTPVTPATPTVSPPVSQSAPTIRVTIGRIDVRAVMPPAPPAPRSRPSRPGPTLSLEDYLQQRREGRR